MENETETVPEVQPTKKPDYTVDSNGAWHRAVPKPQKKVKGQIGHKRSAANSTKKRIHHSKKTVGLIPEE